MNKIYCFLSMSSTMFPPQSNPVIVLLLFTEATKASHSHVLIKAQACMDTLTIFTLSN